MSRTARACPRYPNKKACRGSVRLHENRSTAETCQYSSIPYLFLWDRVVRSPRRVKAARPAHRSRSSLPPRSYDVLWLRHCAALSRFLLCVALSGGLFGVGYYVDPLLVRGGFSGVVVVPVPPFIWLGLGVTFRRIFPSLLAAERREVEIAPCCSHRFVAAIVDEVGAEDLLAIAEKHIMAVPLVHTEVFVEAVGDGVPRHLPAHPRFEARD